MTEFELKGILEDHKKWSDNDLTGKRAVLCGADLRGADLRDAILINADLRGAILINADLRGANLNDADLSNVALSGADLCGADLSGADLRGTNLDFSCLPLWCGSLGAHFDDRQLKQIAYHLVKAGLQSKNASEETKRELQKLAVFANGFHRMAECGLIEVKE